MAWLTSNVDHPAHSSTTGEMRSTPKVIRPSPADGQDLVKPLLPRSPYIGRKLVGFVAMEGINAIKREERYCFPEWRYCSAQRAVI